MGTFDEGRYWVVKVRQSRHVVNFLGSCGTNAGPDEATLHVLPIIWCRNTWSSGEDTDKPELAVTGTSTLDQ